MKCFFTTQVFTIARNFGDLGDQSHIRKKGKWIGDPHNIRNYPEPHIQTWLGL
jgi:hypothetical protein